MKIELRNISHNSRLSEETNCFSARIYVDGVFVADVANRGCGGDDEIHPATGQREKLEALQAYCKALPPITAYGTQIPNDLELVIADLLEAHLIKKDFDRALRSKVLVKTEDGRLLEYSWKGCKAIGANHIEAIAKKHPRENILNLMPQKAALVVFSKRPEQQGVAA